jgi:autotransporter-associated beta strand protein
LTLNNANTYSGGTTIAGGTLALGNSYSLGTGPISMTNSTLAYTGGTTISIGNTLQLSGECTFAAGATTVNLNPPISGTDASITLDTVTGTTFTLQSDMSGFSGTLNLSVGKLRLYANATNFTYTTVNIGDGSLYSHISSAKAIPFGSISGNLASTLRGSDAGSGTDTYTIGSLNQDSLFEGQILDGTKHTLAITKAGTGTLTLGGESGYTGATKVNAGTLLLSGSLGNTEVTVADGATLAGAGTIGSSTGGAVTASNGATISPGNSQGEAGTLKLGNGLTLEAATLVFDLSDDPTGANNDKITLNGGTLTFVATPTFDFNFLDGTLGNGTYTLISGGTDSSGAFPPASNLPSGTRQTFNLGTPANGAIELVVGGTIPASLIWEGTGGGTWDTQTTSAWSSGPTPTFFNFDSVTFDDTGSTGQVLVGSAVEPRSITADNTSTSYSFSGPGVIGGACKLLKTGEGILSISPAYISLASMTTTGSPDVVVATTAGLAAGMTVSGTGIASGTTIAGVTNGTQFTLSQNATASGNASLSYVPRNNYSGGTFINSGSIVLGNDVANAYGLGTGPVTFNGGTLTMYQSSGFAPSGVSNHFIQDLVVPAGQAGTLNADPRCDYDGKLTGSGTLNFRVASNRTNLFGDWSAFSGILNITTASSGEFRMATDYDYPGFPLASINLAGNVKLLYTGKLHSNAGTIIGIGELTGDALSSFRGTDQGGVLTYRIGGRTAYGDEAVFDGTIYEASSDSITSFEKTGAGTWTLGGPCSWNGGSTIEQGTLKISGTVTSAGAVQVNPGATLSLANGTLTTDTVNIAEGASLSGFGTINADLTNDSIVTFASGGQLTISGEVVNNGTMRLTGGTSLNATGPFVNNGVLDLLTASGPLPALLENNGVVILAGDTDVSSYEMTGNSFTLTLLSYSGHVYQLQRATSLAAPTQWEDIGQAQSGVSQSDGTPTPLIFTDEAPPVSRAFYRIEVIL